MQSVTRLCLVAMLCCGVRAVAQEHWLPPRVVDGLAQQLVERFESIGPGEPVDRAALAAGVRKQVLQLREAVEEWGESGVLARAPKFPRLELPSSGQRHLDAMARYQICNLVLMKQFADSPDPDTRRIGALGMTAVTTAVLFLRPPFLASGGRMEQVEPFLTSPAMEREALRTSSSSDRYATSRGSAPGR